MLQQLQLATREMKSLDRTLQLIDEIDIGLAGKKGSVTGTGARIHIDKRIHSWCQRLLRSSRIDLQHLQLVDAQIADQLIFFLGR